MPLLPHPARGAAEVHSAVIQTTTENGVTPRWEKGVCNRSPPDSIKLPHESSDMPCEQRRVRPPDTPNTRQRLSCVGEHALQWVALRLV